MTGTLAPAVERDLDRLVARSHHDPHSLLGIHRVRAVASWSACTGRDPLRRASSSTVRTTR